MGQITTCDFCGAQSPNAEGLHVANHWRKIVDVSRRGDRFYIEAEWQDCCGDCYGKLTEGASRKGEGE